MKVCDRWTLLHTKNTGHHIEFDNCMPKFFHTRKEAREYNTKKYGYIKTRKDLRSHPFNWRMPVPVKVSIDVY